MRFRKSNREITLIKGVRWEKKKMKTAGIWFCQEKKKVEREIWKREAKGIVNVWDREKKREWGSGITWGGGGERGREIVGSVVFGLVFEVCLLWLGVCSRCSDSVKWKSISTSKCHREVNHRTRWFVIKFVIVITNTGAKCSDGLTLGLERSGFFVYYP